MRVRALSVAVATLCLALGASACGGDDSADSSDASAAVIAQIDEICADWKSALDERGAFPVEDFDPESPSPEDLPPSATTSHPGRRLQETQSQEYAGSRRPPILRARSMRSWRHSSSSSRAPRLRPLRHGRVTWPHSQQHSRMRPHRKRPCRRRRMTWARKAAPSREPSASSSARRTRYWLSSRSLSLCMFWGISRFACRLTTSGRRSFPMP